MIHNLFAFAPFFVCLFWTFLLWSTPTDNKHIKKVMGALTLILSIEYFSNIVYYMGNEMLYSYFDDIFILISLSIFPLYYLYMVGLTKETIHQKKYLWHFLPAFILFFLYIIFSMRLSKSEYDAYIINFLHSNSEIIIDPSYKTHQLGLIFLSAQIIHIAQIIIYIILGLKLSKYWKKRIKESLSETVGRDIRLVEYISIFAIILALIGSILHIVGNSYLPKDSIVLLLPGFLLSFVFFKIGLIGYNQNFTIYDLEEIEKSAENISPKKAENASEIRKALESLMDKEQLFLIPDLRISSVCNELHTNRTYLSQVLNDELKENFNSFINKYRVEYAINLLQDSKWGNYSLDKFSELSGFGSTISMIRAFKQIKGKTPSEFRV